MSALRPAYGPAAPTPVLCRAGAFGAPPQPLRLRRFAVLRVLARPAAAARVLDALAVEAEMHRYGIGMIIDACAEYHQPRR